MRNRIFLGEHIEYLVEHPTLGEFLVLIPRQADQGDRYATGDTVSVGWRPKAALVLKGTAAQSLRAQEALNVREVTMTDYDLDQEIPRGIAALPEGLGHAAGIFWA